MEGDLKIKIENKIKLKISLVYANLKIGQPAHRKVGQYKYKEMEKQIK